MSKREATTQADDDLGFAAALKLAIPAGVVLWASAVWGVIRILS